MLKYDSQDGAPISNNPIVISYQPLEEGYKYYFAVQAVDLAGNASAYGNGDGIRVDTGKPVIVNLFDDGNYGIERDKLHVCWEAEKSISNIIEFQYAVASTASPTNLNWRSAGLNRNIVIQPQDVGLMEFAPGAAWYVFVRALNEAGT